MPARGSIVDVPPSEEAAAVAVEELDMDDGRAVAEELIDVEDSVGGAESDDTEEGVSEDDALSSANATPGAVAKPIPIPSATASAPTRPT